MVYGYYSVMSSERETPGGHRDRLFPGISIGHTTNRRSKDLGNFDGGRHGKYFPALFNAPNGLQEPLPLLRPQVKIPDLPVNKVGTVSSSENLWAGFGEVLPRIG